MARLGISHLYVSPILRAAPRSSHGYDVVDPGSVSPELGGDAALARLSEALRAHDMQLLVDIVPNHMATNDRHNVYWYDVLEDGRSSPYAKFFDIDWGIDHPLLQGRVLVPILGDQVGRVLAAGDLAIVREGGLFLRYYDQRLPLAPVSVAELLAGVDDAAVLAVAEAIAALPQVDPTDQFACEQRFNARVALGVKVAAVTASHAAEIDATLQLVNADPERLDAFLQVQNYRLAHWRVASEEINYRRFFDVTTLVGLNMEDSAVFEIVHRRILDLVGDGTIDGLRIDHVDGLREPRLYLERLRAAVGPECWLLVEKILAVDEQLPGGWPVAGTTGYDFASDVLALLVDPAGAVPLGQVWAEFAGHNQAGMSRASDALPEVVHAAKLAVMDEILLADVERLLALLRRVCANQLRHRDHPASALADALREIVAGLPVYRTYAEPGTRDTDERAVAVAITSAQHWAPDLDVELLRLLGACILGDVDDTDALELSRRLPQVAAAVTAKGVEDTAFYRHLRLLALNEVGGDPDRFGIDVATFHSRMQNRTRHAQALLASSTHDTKRSEGVRARLALLSEMPAAWRAAVLHWRTLAAADAQASAVGAEAQYLLFQTLVGAYPLDVDRAVTYMRKAMREAKSQTSWLHPDHDFERRLEAYVAAVLGNPQIVAAVERFTHPLIEWGRVNEIVQTLLKLTCPGVPDIYQGCEIWDLSLVDPDNRRAVDFDVRRRLLDSIGGADTAFATAWADFGSGAPKMLLIQRALQLRASRSAAFDGAYTPLLAQGVRADSVVAFTRGDHDVAVIAPRLVTRLDGGWANTVVELPAGHWRDHLAERWFEGGPVALSELLNDLPIGILERER